MPLIERISSVSHNRKRRFYPRSNNPDILLMPDLEVGNMVYKQLAYLANATGARIVVGAKVPIVHTSRADGQSTRMHAGFIQQKAFTLLELLVAMAVFAVLSSFAYVGLQSVLTTQTRVEQYAKRLAQVQLALFRLQQDIEQAGIRPIRDEYERLESAFRADPLADDALVLTRYGWDNPLNYPRSQLQRIAYQFKEGRLIRRHWLTLDRSGVSEPLEAVLLDNLAEVEWRYLDDGDEWHSQWPAEDGSTVKDRLPRAVEVTLTLRDWGDITRLLSVPY